MRIFECGKIDSCRHCGACCNFRDNPGFDEEDELKIKISLFHKTGTLYLYPFSRYTINLLPKEKIILENDAKERHINITILPKKVFLSDKGIIEYDYFIDADVCPFLNNNRCLIYEHRPLICRQFPEIKYENSSFLKFQKETHIVKVDYEHILDDTRKKLREKAVSC